MQKIIDKGFTLYVTKDENGFLGLGLKRIDDKIHPIEVEKKKINVLGELPAVTKNLEQGNMLQIYYYGFCYFLQLGERCKEGPYGEKDCLTVSCESVDFTLQDALIELEKQASKLEENHQVTSYRKRYRLCGSDKYENII